MKSIAAGRRIPVRIKYSRRVSRPGRSTERVVVLRAAVDVVKGNVIVDVDVIELRDRQVRFEVPVRSTIEALINAAVAAYKQVIRIMRIDPDRVVINVLESLAERSLCTACIVR